MHRDPRFADVERLIGWLTLAQGIGGLLPWPSMLFNVLENYGVRWIWTALFLLVGVGMIGASTLVNTWPRMILLAICALSWLLMAVVSFRLLLPAAACWSVVIGVYSIRTMWRLRRP